MKESLNFIFYVIIIQLRNIRHSLNKQILMATNIENTTLDTVLAKHEHRKFETKHNSSLKLVPRRVLIYFLFLALFPFRFGQESFPGALELPKP